VIPAEHADRQNKHNIVVLCNAGLVLCRVSMFMSFINTVCDRMCCLFFCPCLPTSQFEEAGSSVSIFPFSNDIEETGINQFTQQQNHIVKMRYYHSFDI